MWNPEYLPSKDTRVIMPRISVVALFRLAVGFAAVAAPIALDFSSFGIALAPAEASAKNGGGNGGGNGRGNGGGNNGGNGSRSESRSTDKAGQAQGTVGKAQAADMVDPSLPDIGVRHKRGITEAVVDGRYIMKDARGRTIVNRQATKLDRRRIEALLQ
ncbi:hypothetical protein [Ciceribacter selenitireducens]|uniref:hypothetical protein n=1 Tax=Ciceribacter selenitireducens TaxID=448181 RepID=UPI0011C0501B|nr:hypothetical protein [Ciceribacter selenitireducens]